MSKLTIITGFRQYRQLTDYHLKISSYLLMLVLIVGGVFTSAQAAVMPLKMLDIPHAHMSMSVDSSMDMHSDCCNPEPPPCCQSDNGCSAEPCYCAAISMIAINQIFSSVVSSSGSSTIIDELPQFNSLTLNSLYRPPIS